MAPTRSTARRLGGVLALLALVGSSCAFGDDGDGGSVRLRPDAVESGLPDDPKPTRGGKLVYGLDADSDAFCLPEAQLAISGMQIVRAFYDPLVVPDGEGGYAPYLAKSVESNDDHTVWTITLRSGVTFNDDARTPLDATVVRDNLQAYKASTLFGVVFGPVNDISVVNELTVRITLDRPWVTFDAALYGGGRVGIVSRAQLDSRGTRNGREVANDERDDCDAKLIGTGPFRFVSWSADGSIQGIRNEKYWQEAPDGKPFPYLDAIEFRPIANTDARVVALQQGEINMLHTSQSSDMAGALGQMQADGQINLLVSEDRTETNYLMLNVGNPLSATPPNPILQRTEVRRAIRQALDRQKLNEAQNDGFATLAEGPFAPGTVGYLEDPEAPAYDLDAAKKVVATLKAEGADLTLRYLTSGGPAAISAADLQREMLEAAGFDVKLEVADEADLINLVIVGDYDIAAFRNQPSEDPDSNFHWWYGGSLLNFGGFNDKVINKSLETGRAKPDEATRRKAYEAITRQMASEQYNVYLWYAPWAVAEARNVHGILGPPLPDGGEPGKQIVTGHPLHGIWIDQA